MDEPPRLSPQDRADFEHALAQALARAEVRTALNAAGVRPDDLRARARQSAAGLLAAAAAEFDDYTRLRSAAPEPEPAAARRVPAGGAPGYLGVLALVVPAVAGTAAVVLFALGFGLALTDARHGLGTALERAALVAAALAAACAVVGAVGLVATASRCRPDQQDPSPEDAVAAARMRWRTALLERGMVPFLLDRLADPDDGAQAPFRPGYSSPDFAGPDFAGPDFAGPDFTGPDVTDPDVRA
ncbi:hypothetical protein [Streptomyces sp. NRRL B-24484]|uniref:hypothetical protein n=1 Tax=Streptomyces sp. NRRL B-24484 TaxID=1463833 RepID=UPI000AC7A28D|nr:hypothetical protein [Streptomyces sp. NRRL B-24484]